jgi:ketosteroid isomerase-like protein
MKGQTMNSLATAHDNLYQALNNMLIGDAASIAAIWSNADDISYAGPFGGVFIGRNLIIEEFQRVAAMHLAGRIEVSDVHMVETDDMGFSFCIEHGIDHLNDGQVFSISHRATNVFRREAGGWKLIHHHTDKSAG